MTEPDVDVAIVGYGPVGQTTAALLGASGYSVAVYERHSRLYDLPRAVHFADDVMRIWQEVGIVDEIWDGLLPTRTYDWFGADGEPILKFFLPKRGPSGWDSGYFFFQPELERALDRAARSQKTVAVHRGWAAAALEQHAHHVAMTLRRVAEPTAGVLEPTSETATVRARYVIGADGANSVVRDALGIAFDDQGFAERWLVVDLLPVGEDVLAHLGLVQWCDPTRPHMHSYAGRRRHRFEFMLLPGEQPESFGDEELIWGLLAPWISPERGKLVRHVVYEFRARLAENMRDGRAVLVGDAAHTMPPFMGQGLCAGIRDAASLTWRLDLIMRGLADESLLDAFSAERRAQDEWIVNLSTEMGRVSCVLDPVAAAARDAGMRQARSDGHSAPPFPPLQHGTLAPRSPLAGTLGVQGTVRLDGREGRFDDVVGRGFVLLSRSVVSLPAAAAEFLESIGAIVTSLQDLQDMDGRLTAWFDDHGIEAALIRPDHYLFGAAERADGAAGLVEALRVQLGARELVH